MISLLISLVVLLVGFLVYGKITERVFSPDDRQTPAVAINDGVDCVPMKPWRAFLVQLLNIAGTGPIFGALMGACFGPVVFLWIVFGSVFGGAVHDYMSGMISERHDGASVAELSGVYLGGAAKWIMRVFSIVLPVLTGTVFVTSPAALLARLTPNTLNVTFWIVVILINYVLATLPARFMSAVSMTYILMATEGFRLSAAVGYPAGVVFAAALFAVYAFASRKKQKTISGGTT